jgi:hypothetical protein
MFKNWKNKILNHEETPPKGVWDSISAKMDEEDAVHLPGFVSKLNAYEVAPPPAAWDNIANTLDDEKVVAVNRKNPKLIILYRRVAVAASVLLIITTAILLNNKKAPHKQDAIAKNIQQEKPVPVINTVPPTVTDTITRSHPFEKSTIALHTEKKKANILSPNEDINASKDIDPIDYAKTEAVPLTNDPFANNKEKIRNSNGTIVMDLDQLGAPNTYVITSLGPNGEERRVSSKIAAYIGYLNDKSPDTEEYLDKIIKESSIWKARLKQWSDKLINNSVSPSFSNYLDVFELSNLLSEKK